MSDKSNLEKAGTPKTSKDTSSAKEPDSQKTPGEGGEKGGGEPYLGSWMTKEAAAEGLANMKKVLDEQGNELGAARKQLEFNQQLIAEIQAKGAPGKESKPEKPKGPDYDAEIAAVQTEIANVEKEMAKLDSAEPSYGRDFAELSKKSRTLQQKTFQLVARQQHERTMNSAQAMFREELDERDIQATHRAFFSENPDFNTPEMQMRIREQQAKDSTGMEDDPVIAYRKVQLNDAMTRASELEKENADLKKRLELKKGAEETGTVITEGQSPATPTKKPKVTGAERDKGMMEALQKAKAA
jgi:hypothetical protein